MPTVNQNPPLTSLQSEVMGSVSPGGEPTSQLNPINQEPTVFIENFSIPLENTLTSNLEQLTEPTVGVEVRNEDSDRQLKEALANPKTQITGESKTSHPHLDAKTSEAIKKLFEPSSKEINKEETQSFIKALKDQGIIISNDSSNGGNIDFIKLGLDPKMIKKAGIEGKIFMNEEGKFDFHVTGKCSEEAKQCMQVLKDKLNEIKGDKSIEININPEAVGPLSAEDLAALSRGGQIQYSMLNNQMIKLTLDPGAGGKDDSLTISIYPKGSNKYDNIPDPQPVKIPLNVVFEGAPFGENPGIKPLLPKWREQKLFENSVINEQYSKKFFSRTKIIEKTNQDDPNRIQSQNTLWNAVFEYLKINNTEDSSQQTIQSPEDINDSAKIKGYDDNPIEQESVTQETLKVFDLLVKEELTVNDKRTIYEKIKELNQNTKNLDYEAIQNKIKVIEKSIPEINEGFFNSLITTNALKSKIARHSTAQND